MARIQENPRAKLIKGTAYSFLASILSKIAFIINSIIIARLLGASQLGILTILTSVLGLFSVIAVMGIGGATVKFTAEYDAKNQSRLQPFISTSMTLVCITAFSSVIALLLLSNPIAIGLYKEPQMIGMLFIISIPLFVNAISAPLYSSLQGFQRIREMSIRNILATFITVPVSISLVIIWGLWGAVFGITIGSFIGLGINIHLIRTLFAEKRVKLRTIVDRGETRKLFNYSIPLFLAGVIVSPVWWIVLTYLSQTHGFHSVGLYHVANALSAILLLIPAAISIPMVPLVSELEVRDRLRLQTLSSKLIHMTFVFLFPITLALAVFSRLVLGILYGDAYVDAWPTLYLLSAGTFLIATCNVIVCILAGTGRMWVSLSLNFIWMLTLLLSTFIFVPQFAEIGLGIGFLLSYGVYTAAIFSYAKFKLGVVLHDVELMLPIAAFGFTLGILPSFFSQGPLSHMLSVMILAVLTIAVLIMFKDYEWRFIRDIYGRVSK